MLECAWPAENWFGRSQANGGEHLAGGWAAALCQVRGDWAFYTEVFQFPQWNSADQMCWLCRASSTVRDRAWTDSRPGAGWRRTRWTHEAYIEYLRAAGLAIPVLLLCIVGFRLECVMVDTLHAVDQGVASHVIANTMLHSHCMWYDICFSHRCNSNTLALTDEANLQSIHKEPSPEPTHTHQTAIESQ